MRFQCIYRQKKHLFSVTNSIILILLHKSIFSWMLNVIKFKRLPSILGLCSDILIKWFWIELHSKSYNLINELPFHPFNVLIQIRHRNLKDRKNPLRLRLNHQKWMKMIKRSRKPNYLTSSNSMKKLFCFKIFSTLFNYLK